LRSPNSHFQIPKDAETARDAEILSRYPEDAEVLL
jgi:hypothetical protein